MVGRLKSALRRLEEIEYGCVFGSFARGTTRRGSDIDVLVLGQDSLDRLAVMVALTKVSEHTKREINPDFYTVDEFSHKIDARGSFALEITEGSRIELRGAPPWLR